MPHGRRGQPGAITTGTHYRGAAHERRALDAYIKLMRAAESLTARVHRHLGARGLTVGQFGALEVLHHLGPLCQRDLARKLLRSGGNITMVVDNLQKRGLVARRQDARDRRFLHVHLTRKGERLIGALFPRHVAGLLDEMRVLTKTEQEELGRLCRILGTKDEGPLSASRRHRR